jgi:hypothetical protein
MVLIPGGVGRRETSEVVSLLHGSEGRRAGNVNVKAPADPAGAFAY